LDNTENKNNRDKFTLNGLGIILIILALLTVISSILLAIQLINYINISDKEVVLQSNIEQELEIFSVHYDNASGEITVSGMDGQNVVAPGTSVEYTIRLKNTDKTAIDYDMIPDIRFTSEYDIPILVRMIAPDGSYIAGDTKTWINVEELNSLQEHRTLKKGESVEYTFQWKWEFESGNDEYDTTLGSASVTTDIGLSVEFSVLAEANTDVETNGGFIDSGLGNIVFLGLLVFLLILAIVFLILYAIKKKSTKNSSDNICIEE
jgi:flagellar basal body-associated protein FliL